MGCAPERRRSLPRRVIGGMGGEEQGRRPRALFLSPDGVLYPDALICSGRFASGLRGRPCPFSEEGRMPRPQRLNLPALRERPEAGRSGDLAPPCALQQLGKLEAWSERLPHPADLGPLRVFKCRQMFLLVVPGLRDERAGEIANE